MVTNAKAKAIGLDAPPPAMPTLDEIRLYTAEEVVELKLLPVKARWLKENAYKRRIPHTQIAGRKLRFRLDHILAISQLFDFDPAAPRKRAA